jgi:hypothetical protein
MCLLGFLLHFFMKWSAERTKQPQLSAKAYLSQTKPEWIVSALAAITCMGLLPGLPGLLGLPADYVVPEVLMRFVALIAGYMGSSVVVMITGKVADKLQK